MRVKVLSLLVELRRHQHDIDKLARICRDLAGESPLPLERDALIEMAGRYRTAANERADELSAQPSHDLPNQNFWEGRTLLFCCKCLKKLVGAAGFEPTTCSTQNCRATRLRYTPNVR
jgi:hypothetical protein